LDKKIDEYIEKQNSPQKEICKKLRKIIIKTFPDTKEEMKWGVPSYGNGKYYFVALKDHVNIGFSIKGLSKEELALFSGNGKTMRVIEISSEKDLNEKELARLLKIVNKNV
jgi:hypothetical protein